MESYFVFWSIVMSGIAILFWLGVRRVWRKLGDIEAAIRGSRRGRQ